MRAVNRRFGILVLGFVGCTDAAPPMGETPEPTVQTTVTGPTGGPSPTGTSTASPSITSGTPTSGTAAGGETNSNATTTPVTSGGMTAPETDVTGTTETATTGTTHSETSDAPTASSNMSETTATSGEDSDSTEPAGEPTFLLGADISSLPEALDSGATFVDTDGQTKTILELLKNHGFNAVRLRTFVDPGAPYGYAEGTGGSCRKAEPYNDAAHTAEFGALVKAAGMKLLVDFHYSDTWADPGKQIIPEAWRDATTIDDLVTHVRDYTTDVLEQLVAAGAKPDMVQVGNETTPGMLVHVPGPDTDCWGNNSPMRSGVTGQASNGNWDNLAKLLDAGADAVHALDPDIQVVLHIENTDDLEGVRWWVNSAVSRDVSFDVLGLSAYTAFQGQPSEWENTLETMAEEFPDLKFIIAEYNPERTAANRIVKSLPNERGVGTFFWEPTLGGSWGESMFTQNGNTFTARPADFAEKDDLREELGL